MKKELAEQSKNELMKSRIDKLNIFPTERDKFTNDILSITSPFDTLLPNLFNSELSEQVSSLSTIDGKNIYKSTFGVQEVTKAFLDKDTGTIFKPDLNNLSSKTKELLDKGQYKIADSLKVDGNKRAVIVDTFNHNLRVEDITLKEVKQENADSSANLIEQAQLQEIYEMLQEIQSEQQFQIEWDRNNSILPPILIARTKLNDARDSNLDIQEKISLIKEAITYLEDPSNRIKTDLITNKNHIANLLNKPYKYQSLETHSNYIIRDIQTLTKVTGFQLLIDYTLCNDEKFERTMKNYESSLQLIIKEDIKQPDGIFKKIIKNIPIRQSNMTENKISLLELIHNNYRYTNENLNYWRDFQTEFKQFDKLLVENAKVDKLLEEHYDD